MSLSVRLDKEDYTRGETVEIDLEVEPSKPMPHEGLLTTRIITPKEEYVLQAIFFNFRDKSDRYGRLEFTIPEDEMPGRYLIINKLRLLDNNDSFGDALQREKFFFVDRQELARGTDSQKRPAAGSNGSVAVKTDDGSIKELKVDLYLNDVYGKFAFDEQVKLGGNIKNLSDAKGKLKIQMIIEAKDLSRKTLSKELKVLPRETQAFEFSYSPDRDKPSGLYNAVFMVFQGDYLLDKVDINFLVFDRGPVASFKKMSLKTLIGESDTIEVEVNDDRMVEGVKIFYRLPSQRKWLEKDMKLVKGDSLKGVWRYKTEEYDDLGRFRFYVVAKDNAGQEYKTKNYSIRVIEED